MSKLRQLIGVIMICVNCAIYAEDLGVIAKTYPIIEPDMIEWIKNKATTMMQNGQWDNIKNQAISNVKNQINHPNPVDNISDATETKSWYYTPMIEVKQNLTDGKNHVVAKKGKYNALKYKPFDIQLLFINGNNKKQVEWAVTKNKNDSTKTKIILTQGSFINLDKKYKVWFFYDQQGKYTQKLNITHVPAIVIQEGEELKVTEISNNEL